MNTALKGITIGATLVLALLGSVAGYNHVAVGSVVRNAVSSDERNDGLTLRAHFGSYVDPGTLVLDLTRADAVAPVDLWRALFHSAEAFHMHGRRFESVVLARAGTPVFVMKGEDFARLGAQRSYGENPIYVIRKLPSKLYHPDGTAAYGEWSGGLFAVLSKEMEDSNSAASRWATGSETPEMER